MPEFDFYWWAMQRGWKDSTMVRVLLQYIENQDASDGLEDFAKQADEGDE